MGDRATFGQRWATYKASKPVLLWSCAACVVGTIVVGFAWGGWVTGSSAREMSETAAEGARRDLVASICVERFNANADASVQLAALKELKSWQQSSFITKGGWATMPDGKQATSKAASLCAEQLASAEAPRASATP